VESLVLADVPPRVGAAAALAGGLIWVAKAASILLTGSDVVVGVDLGALFVAVQVLFGVTILGLHEVVARTGVLSPGADAPIDVITRAEQERELARDQGEPLGFEDPAARIRRRAGLGYWCGVVTIVLGTVALAAVTAGADAVGGLAALGTSLTWIIGLMGVGLATAELRAVSGRSTSLPFRMGLGAVPAFVAGGVLTLLDERLLDLPVLVYGVLFLVLARQLWRADPVT
jgi:hypothetical protein